MELLLKKKTPTIVFDFDIPITILSLRQKIVYTRDRIYKKYLNKMKN